MTRQARSFGRGDLLRIVSSIAQYESQAGSTRFPRVLLEVMSLELASARSAATDPGAAMSTKADTPAAGDRPMTMDTLWANYACARTDIRACSQASLTWPCRCRSRAIPLPSPCCKAQGGSREDRGQLEAPDRDPCRGHGPADETRGGNCRRRRNRTSLVSESAASWAKWTRRSNVEAFPRATRGCTGEAAGDRPQDGSAHRLLPAQATGGRSRHGGFDRRGQRQTPPVPGLLQPDRRQQCDICSNPTRDQSIVCVVEEPADVLTLEQSGQHRGAITCWAGSCRLSTTSDRTTCM